MQAMIANHGKDVATPTQIGAGEAIVTDASLLRNHDNLLPRVHLNNSSWTITIYRLKSAPTPRARHDNPPCHARRRPEGLPRSKDRGWGWVCYRG